MLWYVAFISSFTLIDSKNVLMMHSYFAGSHAYSLRRLATALGEQGDKVTIVRFKEIGGVERLTSPGVEEIILHINNSLGTVPLISHEEHGQMQFPQAHMYKNGNTIWTLPLSGLLTVTAHCNQLLGDANLYHRLESMNYSVAVIDSFSNDCSFALANRIGIPIIGYWAFSINFGNGLHTATITTPSVTPYIFSQLSDTMCFLDRLKNTAAAIMLHLYQTIFSHWSNRVIQKHYPGSPSPRELYSNLSGAFIDIHPVIAYPTVHPTTFLQIGGIHMNPPKPLPQDISQFIDEAEDGLIIFSLGHTFNEEYMPEQEYQKYFDAFSRLKQRVILKAISHPRRMPQNVKILPFMPQTDILAHNNTVLFITHCGIKGMLEGVYHAVPMLAIPIFIDQFDNAVRLINLGAGVSVNKDSSVEVLVSAINEVIYNYRYKTKVEELSRLVKLHGIPLKAALNFVDFIAETRGAPHLKLASRNLNIFQILCIDIFAFILVSSSISLILMYLFVKSTTNELARKFAFTLSSNVKLQGKKLN